MGGTTWVNQSKEGHFPRCQHRQVQETGHVREEQMGKLGA